MDITNYFTPHYTLIALFLSFYVLYLQKYAFPDYIKYLFFIVINGIINIILKNMIKQPRPLSISSIDKDKNKDKDLLTLILQYDKYGMPSGHTQFMGFNTLYTYLISKNVYILVLQSIVTILSFRQRIMDGFHTFKQTLFGLIIGTIVAYSSYSYLYRSNHV